jgi:hypothetical protein
MRHVTSCYQRQMLTSTKLVMKLKLVSLESGSSLSNDAIFVSIRCIVSKISAFKTTPLKIATFRPDENEVTVALRFYSISDSIHMFGSESQRFAFTVF